MENSRKHKYTTELFIEKAKLKHGDRYDYSKVEYNSAREKVTIGCSIHGYFEQIPESHLKPRGCFKCGYLDYNRYKTYDVISFIEKAKEVHNNIYEYSKVDYISYKEDVIIVCPVHGDFKQKPHNHLKRGCQKCAIDLKYGTSEEKTKDFIEKSIEVHGTLYDYGKTVVVDNKVKIIITCKEHGDFETTPPTHLKIKSVACPRCRRYDTESFINTLSLIHSSLDFSNTVFKKIDEKVKYVCNKHGEIEALPSNLLKGHGCRECSFEKQKEKPFTWSHSS